MTDKELDNLLEERLTRLEAGEPLEMCLAGLPESEARLLKKAVRLRALPHTIPDVDKVASQRRELLRLAKENGRKMTPQSPQMTQLARPRWALPALALAGLAALFICVFITSALGGVAWLWRNAQPPEVAQNPSAEATSGSAQGTATPSVNPTAVALDPADPQSGVVREARGLVEVQASDGTWQAVKAGHVVRAGQRIRTGALSSGTLAFYDGSQARLGPNSELSVEALDAQKSGPRVIALRQWVGDSDHDVAPSSDAGSRYEVATPSGVGTAKGTAFHVFVSITLLVRFDVNEGAVDVTSLNITVIVVAGQSTVIVSGQPPAEPFFRITGEGQVERIGTTWRIAGRTFLTNDNTVILGHPQVGDWVAFEARVLPDGTRFADRIILLHRALENRFAFTGTVDTIGENEWTIGGRVVKVDELTGIEEGIQVGDLVEVKGGITQDGTLWASRINLVEMEEPGLPFTFTGVVESITDTVWTISGISVTVNVSTTIEAGIAASDIVHVKGRILEDGTWLAQSIERAEESEREFVIVGRVESMDPWIVAGIEFETAEWTEIEEGIEVGDRVRVEGRILEDGTWLAAEIELLEEDDEPRRFQFVDRVTSIDPWIVGGIALSVNEQTRLKGEIAVGDLVRVKGIILPDGTFLAREIKRLHHHRGCFDLTTAVRTVSAEQIVLLDWQVVNLKDIHVEGEIKIATVIVIHGCVSEDGTFIVVNIIVIYQLDVLPIIIPQPPDHHDGEEDDDE